MSALMVLNGSVNPNSVMAIPPAGFQVSCMYLRKGTTQLVALPGGIWVSCGSSIPSSVGGRVSVGGVGANGIELVAGVTDAIIDTRIGRFKILSTKFSIVLSR